MLGFLGSISSASFVIPNTDIMTFISTVCNSVVIIALIFFYFRLIKKIATFDLSLLNDLDIDKTINLF